MQSFSDNNILISNDLEGYNDTQESKEVIL